MVSVVFILVVLAALGAALADISQRQHLAAASDLQAARAYQAARAGLEWWAYWQANAGTANGDCMSTNSIVPGGTLSGFTVTLTCTRTPAGYPATASDGATALTFWTVVANACNAPVNGACPATSTPAATYVERQLTWTIVR
jgi:MSHA biogenesis protein MshP